MTELQFKMRFNLAKLQYPQFAKMPWQLLYAQAKLETGNFSSQIYKENKNLFGLKKPKIRPTFAIGENRGHATYYSRYECIKDYFERSKAFKATSQFTDVETWLTALVSTNYAEDIQYIVKLRQIYNTLVS